MLKIISLSFLSILFLSCTNDNTSVTNPIEKIVTTKSQNILNQSIAAHGGDLYNTAHYSFNFRGDTYEFKNNASTYKYTKTTTSGDSIIIDVLTNAKFERTVNGNPTLLSNQEIESGNGAINSVIYFATLPYKLNDKAVNTIYIDSIIIKEQNYDVIEITFDQAGGGEDHNDEYYYWINKDTKKIDYFAYNYTVNGGGVRFRSAYNARVVDGITFQDYINYEAVLGTPLHQLPLIYEAGELKELSNIDTENVINMK
jgi:hypothetical protein